MDNLYTFDELTSDGAGTPIPDWPFGAYDPWDPEMGYYLDPDTYGERAVMVRCFPTPNGKRVKLRDLTAADIDECTDLLSEVPGNVPDGMSYVVKRGIAASYHSDTESHVRSLIVQPRRMTDFEAHMRCGGRLPPVYAWLEWKLPYSALSVVYRDTDGAPTHGEQFIEIEGSTTCH